MYRIRTLLYTPCSPFLVSASNLRWTIVHDLYTVHCRTHLVHPSLSVLSNLRWTIVHDLYTVHRRTHLVHPSLSMLSNLPWTIVQDLYTVHYRTHLVPRHPYQCSVNFGGLMRMCAGPDHHGGERVPGHGGRAGGGLGQSPHGQQTELCGRAGVAPLLPHWVHKVGTQNWSRRWRGETIGNFRKVSGCTEAGLLRMEYIHGHSECVILPFLPLGVATSIVLIMKRARKTDSH